MHLMLSIVVHTANILGIFSDPFEFEGDYGQEVNAIRHKVFEKVSNERDLPLSEVVTENEIEGWLQFKVDIRPILDRDGNKKVLDLLRSYPKFSKLDHRLRDQAAREGKDFDLPILSSVGKLEGDLKKRLLDALSQSEEVNLDTFYFWLFHARNLQLVSEDPELIEEVNLVKEIFSKTIGNSKERAESFKEKIREANTSVLFTQECDAVVPQLMIEFHSIDRQNPNDGCYVFLRSDLWDDYEIVPIPGFDMNVVLSTFKQTEERFLLASCHGHSTKPEDGRLQIRLVMEKYKELGIEDLQVLIGIDANTKSEKDIHDLREHLESLGLVATSVGPTTVKKRVLSAQTSKAGKLAVDEEDYLIVLKKESGGHYLLNHQTVGFKEERADPTRFLPNLDNQSDHYPVGATLE